MVKVKAENVPEKGILQKILVNSNTIKKGEDIALISTLNGSFKIKSPYDGTVAKWANLGEGIKKGSTICTLLTNDKEIQKFLKHQKPKTFYSENKEDNDFGSMWKEVEEDDFLDRPHQVIDVDGTTPRRQPVRKINNGEHLEKNRSIKSNPSQQNPELKFIERTKNAASKAVSNGTKSYKNNLKIREELKIRTRGGSSSPINSGSTSNPIKKPDNAADIILGRSRNNPEEKTNSLKSNSFRSKIKSRIEELHKNNDYKEINTDSNAKSAMDFVDENGVPETLRNITYKRLNKFREDNMYDEVTSDEGNADMINNNNNSNPGNPAFKNPQIINSMYQTPYHENRTAILRGDAQRNLIKKRMQQIANGEIRADNSINGINNFVRPSLEEMNRQLNNPDYIPATMSGLGKDIVSNSSIQTPNNARFPNEVSQNSMAIQEDLQTPTNGGVDFIKELNDFKQEMQMYNDIQLQSIINKLNQREEAKSDSTNSFDKIMQYMMIQTMMNNSNLGADKRSQIEEMAQGSFFNTGVANRQNPIYDKQLSRYNSQVNTIVPTTKITTSMLEEAEKLQKFDNNDEKHDINPKLDPAIKSLILSQNLIPPLTIKTNIDMTELLKVQLKIKNSQQDNKIRFNTLSFLIKAISIALFDYPRLNSMYDSRSCQVVVKKSHHIAIGTQTSKGLILPVLKFADRLSLREIAINIQEKTDRIKNDKLEKYEVLNSTITIANYGSIGADSAVQSIFYPNAALVAVGRINKKPVINKSGKISARSIMGLSLSVDQRIVDAVDAGGFLNKIKELLEKPELISVS